MYIYLSTLTGFLMVGDRLATNPDILRDYYVGHARNRKEAIAVITSHNLYRDGIFGMSYIKRFVKEEWEN